MKLRYFQENREKMFPWVHDWTDPQDHWRYYPDVRNLSYKMWFWFHPSAYHLMNTGISVIGILFFALAMVYGIQRGIWLLVLVCAIMVIFNVFRILKIVKMWPYIKDMNFYDLYLRDSEVEK